jgi:hypothetical protein
MPQAQLFEALHKGTENVMQKKRLKFFWLLFIGIFIWEWFPVSFLVFNKSWLIAFVGVHCPVRY